MMGYLLMLLIALGFIWWGNNYLNDRVLKKDLDYVWALDKLRKGGKTFYFVLSFFPLKQRKEIVYYYAFCRITDDMIDESNNPTDNLNFLKSYYSVLYKHYDAYKNIIQHNKESGEELYRKSIRELETFLDRHIDLIKGSDVTGFKKFHELIYTNLIDRKYSELLIKGYESDVRGHEFETIQGLIQYCVYVAGSIGIIMCILFGVNDPDILRKANAYGIALQLTNISRDIITDSKLGRVYVPNQVLANNGLTRTKLLDICEDHGKDSNNRMISRLSVVMIETAEDYYVAGVSGINSLPVGIGIPFFLLGFIYREIGMKIRIRDRVRQRYVIREYTGMMEKIMSIFKGMIYYLDIRIGSSVLHDGIKKYLYHDIPDKTRDIDIPFI